jgi:organic hydroperoxide reductase OsmC/OhrA
MLAAAIGNCLAASLMFCMQKKRVKLERVKSKVTVEIVRNEAKRLRVGQVRVELHPGVASGPELEECMRSFEDFCTVTQSVRAGLDVRVEVLPEPG